MTVERTVTVDQSDPNRGRHDPSRVASRTRPTRSYNRRQTPRLRRLPAPSWPSCAAAWPAGQLRWRLEELSPAPAATTPASLHGLLAPSWRAWILLTAKSPHHLRRGGTPGLPRCFPLTARNFP